MEPPHGPMPGDMDCDCALCLHQTAVTDTRRQIRNLLQYLHELSAQQDAAEAGMPTGAPPTPPVVVRAAPAAALAAHARLVAPDGAGAPRSRSAAAGAPAAPAAPAAAAGAPAARERGAAGAARARAPDRTPPADNAPEGWGRAVSPEGWGRGGRPLRQRPPFSRLPRTRERLMSPAELHEQHVRAEKGGPCGRGAAFEEAAISTLEWPGDEEDDAWLAGAACSPYYV